MTDGSLDEGDLIAYLEGDRHPEVERALQESSPLRTQLEELRRGDQQFRRLFGGLDVPDPQDLVDVASGQATPRQQLRVAAYIRESARGRAEMAALIDAVPPGRRLLSVPLLALPSLAPFGTRSSSSAEGSFGLRADATELVERDFYVSEVRAQVTVQVRPVGEQWQIQGRVTQQEKAVVGAPVALRAFERRPRRRVSDAAGFFTFHPVDAGVYQLQVTVPDGRIIVPEIVLTDA